jgi:hypothetical protein
MEASYEMKPVVSRNGYISSLAEDLRFSAGGLNHKNPFEVCFYQVLLF